MKYVNVHNTLGIYLTYMQQNLNLTWAKIIFWVNFHHLAIIYIVKYSLLFLKMPMFLHIVQASSQDTKGF
jgi:hypothetical protein